MNAPVANATLSSIHQSRTAEHSRAADASATRVRSVWAVLKVTFSVVPVVAGLDKFTDLLTNWDAYINPMLARALPISTHAFMGVVGVIEIAAGVLVIARPRLGASVVAAWLTCIALSLLAGGQYLDVAVRDLVMAISALTLARLTPLAEPPSSVKA